MNNKMIDTYLSHCNEVDEFSKAPPQEEDAYTFYRHDVMQAKGPILEPICGTGRFLLP